MTIEEAEGWINGSLSMCNTFHLHENAELLTIQADLAMMQQAYIVLKAHSEKLLEQQNNRNKLSGSR